MYLVMANRRKVKGTISQRLGGRFGARGLVRGGAMALAAGNLVGCGITYAFGKREEGPEKEV